MSGAGCRIEGTVGEIEVAWARKGFARSGIRVSGFGFWFSVFMFRVSGFRVSGFSQPIRLQGVGCRM